MRGPAWACLPSGLWLEAARRKGRVPQLFYGGFAPIPARIKDRKFQEWRLSGDCLPHRLVDSMTARPSQQICTDRGKACQRGPRRRATDPFLNTGWQRRGRNRAYCAWLLTLDHEMSGLCNSCGREKGAMKRLAVRPGFNCPSPRSGLVALPNAWGPWSVITGQRGFWS